ncbi:hypothetical protein P43SY_006073 [Pythium insidiosum]|uniref:Uncharacterized protein n=1 Tax=Pythium insidiosum TaxID=114742 RepID=A0AAD5M975_PYTIN|nr:hypothetical protein P43SY_006073 [Pythium insidiosum]
MLRSANHRGSISVAVGPGAAGAALSEETRKRHRESKKRMESADFTQLLLFQAHDLEQRVEDMPLHLHARAIPPCWRREIVQHLTPILHQLRFCRRRVINAWRLLLPPFDRANLHEYEQRLQQFHQSVRLLDQALDECDTQVTAAERHGASAFLQRWYRNLLAKRGFYTKTLQLSRHHRGLIPGIFSRGT